MKCSSCHKNVISENDFTKLKCPACGKEEIIRCRECRRKSNTYTCKCGFVGP